MSVFCLPSHGECRTFVSDGSCPTKGIQESLTLSSETCERRIVSHVLENQKLGCLLIILPLETVWLSIDCTLSALTFSPAWNDFPIMFVFSYAIGMNEVVLKGYMYLASFPVVRLVLCVFNGVEPPIQ